VKHVKLLFAKSLMAAKEKETNLEGNIMDKLLDILVEGSEITTASIIFTSIDEELNKHLNDLVTTQLKLAKQKPTPAMENVALDVFVSKIRDLIDGIKRLSLLGGGDALDVLEEKVNNLKETVNKIMSHLPVTVHKETIADAVSALVNLLQEWSNIPHLGEKIETLLNKIIPKVEEFLQQVESATDTKREKEEGTEVTSEDGLTLRTAADEVY